MHTILLGRQIGGPSLVVGETFGAEAEFFFGQLSSFFKPSSVKKRSS
jgi:hypothetical protein